MDSGYLSSTQAARRLGISSCTVRRAVRRGELRPAVQTPGGWLRFRAGDVDAYLQHLTQSADLPSSAHGARVQG